MISNRIPSEKYWVRNEGKILRFITPKINRLCKRFIKQQTGKYLWEYLLQKHMGKEEEVDQN